MKLQSNIIAHVTTNNAGQTKHVGTTADNTEVAVAIDGDHSSAQTSITSAIDAAIMLRLMSVAAVAITYWYTSFNERSNIIFSFLFGKELFPFTCI